jgi:phenylpropionate dioxygenase-like ring-hydroxylating dioxygenase large terminal subunit
MSHGISVGRYVDPEFQKLEYDKLWSRVWQVAIRADEIPEANDYTVYRIGDRSVLLVRVDQNTIKAYHNVCPHRGTALADGCGAFNEGRIICPFPGVARYRRMYERTISSSSQGFPLIDRRYSLAT